MDIGSTKCPVCAGSFAHSFTRDSVYARSRDTLLKNDTVHVREGIPLVPRISHRSLFKTLVKQHAKEEKWEKKYGLAQYI
jgi:hypothetical protein